MEASNSHSYLTDKKIQAKKSTHDEHKQGQSQFRAVENNPGSVVMNSCATLPAPQPPSNTVTTHRAAPVRSHKSHSSNTCSWRHLVLSNNWTSAPLAASLAEFNTKAAKIFSASQNDNRLRLIWHALCSLAKNDFPRDFHIYCAR